MDNGIGRRLGNIRLRLPVVTGTLESATGGRMAYIRMISEDDAEGNLKKLYGRLLTPEGDVDNILKIHSLNEASLEGHLRLYKTLMYGRSGLSRTQREMIAVSVSVLNHCHY
jgi:alkylhydroperoxidase family enzyme